MDSLWSQRERAIFTLSLGGKEKKYDPLKVARGYHQAVMQAGGIERINQLWKHWCSEPQPSNDDWLKSWNEAGEVLANVSRQTFGADQWSEDKPEGFTDGEAINAFGQYLVFSAKKDEGAGKSSTASTPSAPGPEQPNEASPDTQTTSASSTAGT
jgi:hypothetical protein